MHFSEMSSRHLTLLLDRAKECWISSLNNIDLRLDKIWFVLQGPIVQVT